MHPRIKELQTDHAYQALMPRDAAHLAHVLTERLSAAFGTERSDALVKGHWPEICAGALSPSRKLKIVAELGSAPFLTAFEDVEPSGYVALVIPEETLPVSKDQLVALACPGAGAHSREKSPYPAKQSFATDGPYWLRLAIVLDALRRNQRSARIDHYLRYLLTPCRVDGWKAAGGLPHFDGSDDSRGASVQVAVMLGSLAIHVYGAIPVSLPQAIACAAFAELETAFGRLSTLCASVDIPADLRKAYAILEGWDVR